jgi:hypothetical protein
MLRSIAKNLLVDMHQMDLVCCRFFLFSDDTDIGRKASSRPLETRQGVPTRSSRVFEEPKMAAHTRKIASAKGKVRFRRPLSQPRVGIQPDAGRTEQGNNVSASLLYKHLIIQLE